MKSKVTKIDDLKIINTTNSGMSEEYAAQVESSFQSGGTMNFEIHGYHGEAPQPHRMFIGGVQLSVDMILSNGEAVKKTNKLRMTYGFTKDLLNLIESHKKRQAEFDERYKKEFEISKERLETFSKEMQDEMNEKKERMQHRIDVLKTTEEERLKDLAAEYGEGVVA